MTELYDIVDAERLSYAMSEGLVSCTYNKTGRLAILNYTNRAQVTRGAFDNPAVCTCRGLIFDTSNGDVVARPFPKFFNYDQREAYVGKWEWDTKGVACNKVDGSLGIIYPDPEDDRYKVATRGSFTSEQAVKATEMLSRHLIGVEPGRTTLVEIVYPENRIVLDYGEVEALALLGSVSIETGEVRTPGEMGNLNHLWSGPAVGPLDMTLREAIEMKRANAEGWVFHFPDGRIVKVKQPDYIERHRVRFGLNELRVWEHMRDNPDRLDLLLEPLPDEVHEWTRDAWTNLADARDKLAAHYMSLAEWYMTGLEPGDRAGFARAIEGADHKSVSALWLALDGRFRDLQTYIVRKMLRPHGGGEGAKHTGTEGDSETWLES